MMIGEFEYEGIFSIFQDDCVQSNFTIPQCNEWTEITHYHQIGYVGTF